MYLLGFEANDLEEVSQFVYQFTYNGTPLYVTLFPSDGLDSVSKYYLFNSKSFRIDIVLCHEKYFPSIFEENQKVIADIRAESSTNSVSEATLNKLQEIFPQELFVDDTFRSNFSLKKTNFTRFDVNNTPYYFGFLDM